jgi:hypothetical protein
MEIDDLTYKHLSDECNNLKVKLWNYILTLDRRIKNEKSNGKL